MRLDDAVSYFVGQWPSEGASRATVRTYTSQLRWLARFAEDRGDAWLDCLSPDLLRAAMAAKMASHAGASKGGEAAAHSLAFAARCMATWLVAQGVPVADLSNVKARKPPERIQPRLQQREFAAMESSILHRLVDARARLPRTRVARDLALIYMLANTGLRAAEVCAMTVESVDFQLGAVLVLRGKGRKQRALSILDRDDQNGGITLQLLADWIEARGALPEANRNAALWTSMRGASLGPAALRLVLSRICEDAGISGNRPPHAFRRANFTESYLAEPNSIRVLASRMGWSARSAPQMIEIYTRGVDVDLARNTPMPAVTARWQRATEAARQRPTIAKMDADRAASQSPRRRRPMPG